MTFDRSTALSRLEAEEFDVVIVGGGITGAGCALDAVSRGLRTALVERDDFAFGTSSRSSKLVHGGVRYLQHREFGLVREALAERQIALKNAPHLVQAMPFLIPIVTDNGLIDRRIARLLGAVLWMYDLSGGLRIKKAHTRVTKAEALAQVPMQHAMLVFPTGEVPAAPPQPLPERLLVLDASWSQARRMWRKLTPLRGVATLRLPEIQAPAARLRKAPGPGFVSTIEAVAAALRFLEGESSAAPLEQLYQHCVARMRAIGRTGIAHDAAPSEFADVDD